MFAYDEYGAPDGLSVFYFHGSPSSRLEWDLFGGGMLANRLNIRVIVPDRPGSAGRRSSPAGQIRDWPHDVVELAKQLTLARIPVVRMPPPAR